MTFGLFTNIASRARGKHIHKYVPASGSVSGYIRHPAPKPGSSSSGSETGSSSSGSDTGYSSFGSSFPIPGHPTIPSGGTVIPTDNREPRVVLIFLTDHPSYPGRAGIHSYVDRNVFAVIRFPKRGSHNKSVFQLPHRFCMLCLPFEPTPLLQQTIKRLYDVRIIRDPDVIKRTRP